MIKFPLSFLLKDFVKVESLSKSIIRVPYFPPKKIQVAFSNAEKLLSSSLNDWGLALATCDSLSPVWGQFLCDPFLRRLLLRFVQYNSIIYCWFWGLFQFLCNYMRKLFSSYLIISLVLI